MRAIDLSEAALRWSVVAGFTCLLAATAMPVWISATSAPFVSFGYKGYPTLMLMGACAVIGVTPLGTFPLLAAALACYAMSSAGGRGSASAAGRAGLGFVLAGSVLHILGSLWVNYVVFGGGIAFPLGWFGTAAVLWALGCAGGALGLWPAVPQSGGPPAAVALAAPAGYGGWFFLEYVATCLWLAAATTAVVVRLGPATPSHFTQYWNVTNSGEVWYTQITFSLPRGAVVVLTSGVLLVLRAQRCLAAAAGYSPAARLRLAMVMIVGLAALLAFGDICYEAWSRDLPTWMAWRLWLLWEFYTFGAISVVVSLVVVLRNLVAALGWSRNELRAQKSAKGIERLASAHFWSACTLGAYGAWVALGGGSRTADGALKKHGTYCWQWSVVCVLLIPCLFGMVGGLGVAICLLATALVPPSGIGAALGVYEALVAIAYLWVFIAYSMRAYRRVLGGDEPAYPMARAFGLR